MIYDCFSYNGEQELLEIRLNHHTPFVDKFVITECPWTYSGIEKPLYYDSIKDYEPFVKFKDKIIHNIYDVPPDGNTGWPYENDQRNSLRKLGFNQDDIIIYADCDELIRNGSIIRQVIEAIDMYPIITLDMEMCWYYFNCQIKPGSEFQQDYSMESCFNHRWLMAKIFDAKYINSFKDLYQIRELNLWDKRNSHTIKKAGWHFSNFGCSKSIYNKFCSFSHSKDLDDRYEISLDAIEQRKAELQDPLGRNVSFIMTELDVPDYVLENFIRYSEYFLIA